MNSRNLMVALVLIFFVGPGNSGVRAQGKGHGNGKGQEKQEEKQEKKAEHGGHGRSKHYDREVDHNEARGWYVEHRGNLPPGLAKREQLPPGLQRQLVVRGTLPPGLQARVHPVPEDLEVRLSPPPPECAHVLVGGNIVLLNRRTNLVIDVVAFY
jgi:hypothetical protein